MDLQYQTAGVFGQESPILGYAYPPDDLDNWPAGSAAESKNLDGVVLHYKAIGIGSFDVKGIGSIPMRGEPVCTEVGHYLGLHTYQVTQEFLDQLHRLRRRG